MQVTSQTRVALKAERQARDARIAKAKADMAVHVARGTCPDCGSPLKANSSMAGWWQCVRYATDSMRAPQYRGLPSCSFQGFV